MNRRRALALVALVALVGVVPAQAASNKTVVVAAKAKPQRTKKKVRQWCATKSNSDWLCSIAGRIAADSRPVTARKPTRLRPGASVHIDPGGLARMRFARQAMCELGLGDQPTEIVTRFGGQDRLYRQTAGRSYCSFARNATEVLPFFCDEAQACPVIVKANGAALVVHTSNPVILDFCAGSYDITVSQPSGSSRVAGSTSDVARVHAVITQTENSIDLQVTAVADAGACDSPTFRSLKRAVQQL